MRNCVSGLSLFSPNINIDCDGPRIGALGILKILRCGGVVNSLAIFVPVT